MSNPRQVIQEALVELFNSAFGNFVVDMRMRPYNQKELDQGCININIISERLKEFRTLTPEIQVRECVLNIFVFLTDSDETHLDKTRERIDQVVFDIENILPESIEEGYQSYALDRIDFGKSEEGETPIRFAKMIYFLRYEFTPTPNSPDDELDDLDRMQITNDLDNASDKIGTWTP